MRTDASRLALNVRRGAGSSPATVHIFLQRVVRQANGMLAVTPVCSSLAEIENEIKAMQRELEAILRLARQTYGVKSPVVGAGPGPESMRAGA